MSALFKDVDLPLPCGQLSYDACVQGGAPRIRIPYDTAYQVPSSFRHQHASIHIDDYACHFVHFLLYNHSLGAAQPVLSIKLL